MNILAFFILGLLTSLLFPPYFFFPLGFLIFPVLCHTIEKNITTIKKIHIFKYSFFYSFGLLISFLFWMQNPFFVYNETKILFFLFIILIIFLSLIFSTIFLFFINYNNFLNIVFILPLIFITSEYLISILLYGFPWITSSLIVANNDFFSISFKYFGTLITSYFVIQIFCLPYLFFTKTKPNIQIYIFIILSILPILFILLHNFKLDTNKITNKEITLELFQLNHDSTINNNNSKKLDNIIELISNSESEILIFAENNYPFLINDLKLEAIQNNIKNKQTVIIGGTRFNKNNYFNTLLNINKSKINYFDKKILVPFGEFLPLRNYLKNIELISGPNDYTEGKIDRLITLQNKIRYIPVICYEIIFYWKLLDKLNYDSNFIINITNDIWFGKFLGPYQHFYLTKIRAVEFNKPIIRVSNNGISAIIDKNGKVIKSTQLNQTQILKYKLKIENNKNYFQIHKFLKVYFLIICIFIIIFKLKKINDHRKISI